MDGLIVTIYFFIKTYIFSKKSKINDMKGDVLFSLLVSIISFVGYFQISSLYTEITNLASKSPYFNFPPYFILLIITDLITTYYVKRKMYFNKKLYYFEEILRINLVFILFIAIIILLSYSQVTQIVFGNK